MSVFDWLIKKHGQGRYVYFWLSLFLIYIIANFNMGCSLFYTHLKSLKYAYKKPSGILIVLSSTANCTNKQAARRNATYIPSQGPNWIERVFFPRICLFCQQAPPMMSWIAINVPRKEISRFDWSSCSQKTQVEFPWDHQQSHKEVMRPLSALCYFTFPPKTCYLFSFFPALPHSCYWICKSANLIRGSKLRRDQLAGSDWLDSPLLNN